jgi:hypothetical protein
MRIEGQLIGLFSFDIGYEIDLERVRRLMAPAETSGLEKRRAAPAYVAYAKPPVLASLGMREVRLGDAVVEASASAVIHEFGAVTVMFRTPLRCEVSSLPGLTATLSGASPMERLAREMLEEIFRRIQPAISRPGLNEFVEDYYIVQVDRFDEAVSIPELLARERATLASALRCESSPLSEAEVDEVFRSRVSYYPNDLVVSEWNVALIVDPDYTDALNILEYLNVQLAELRYYDALLERRVEQMYATTTAPPRITILRYRPYRGAIEELAAMRLDVAAVFERIHNAIKLSGDLYLAKVYGRAADRMGLPAWEQSVAQKIDVLQKMYNVLVERVTTSRAELLELSIILLIVLELLVLLTGLA